MTSFFKSRGIVLVAIAAAMLCALVPMAKARQPEESTTKSTSKKPTPKHHKTSSKTHIATNAAQISKSSTSVKRSSRRKKRVRGQQKIDAERARSIQAALIREHYLSGEPSGTWNTASEEAMRRYQADHGWQSKTVPDSRALISLGLGPSKDHLLNPESAMTTGPEAPRSQAMPATSQPPAPVSTPATPTQADPPSPQ